MLKKKELKLKELEHQLSHYNKGFGNNSKLSTIKTEYLQDTRELNGTQGINSEEKWGLNLKSCYTFPIETAINKLTVKMHDYLSIRNENDPLNDEATIIRVLEDIRDTVGRADLFIINAIRNEKFSGVLNNCGGVMVDEDYKTQRMNQLSEIYSDVNKIRNEYCFKMIEDLKQKNSKLTSHINRNQIFSSLSSNLSQKQVLQNENINSGIAILKCSQLESVIDLLRSQLEILHSSKARVQIEEIDKIQQKTMKEMHTLNEQAILTESQQFKQFAGLDLGKEMASLKVLLRESETELEMKSCQNNTLKIDLIKAETKIKDLCLKMEELNTLPSIDQLETMHKRQSVKFINTSEDYSEESISELFFNKLQNTYNLCQNIHDRILNTEGESSLKSSNAEFDQLHCEIERLKSEQELQI